MVHLNGLIHGLTESSSFPVGGWFSNADYLTARMIGDSSADFTIIDMEHTGFSMPDLGQTMQWLISRRRLAQARPIPASPIVRVSPNAAERNQWVTKQALDYGAFGILVPQVVDPEDVVAAVSAMRYPQGPGGKGPEGVRGALPTHSSRYWGISVPEYIERADLWPLTESGELTLLLLVENVKAWERIDEILAVPGVGALIWGPADGAMTLGVRDFNLADSKLDPYRRKVIEAAKAAGVPIGTPGAVDVFQAIDEGMDFLCLPKWSEDTANAIRDYAAKKR
ncbi:MULTISPECIES: HpcH/HpaI aldolase/citrate lyase family protein [Paenarthrobacter]|uniref:HpcH/HpaI aldolase/citrate lyase domain-containing protein n=1 Tax=Paenarthrobacter aromaticivorans TaxID=2849150 RepID=A0ABS6IDP3_9MICC|nr:aldolase/citrate lyase family protein [Paenarthrobacter sp. MMS21-TAE1-1]MBU8868537.1 hypothetical protein [Paenarthrobacter sp. MMS21-TAE1-1]